jgi:hypothetical protein
MTRWAGRDAGIGGRQFAGVLESLGVVVWEADPESLRFVSATPPLSSLFAVLPRRGARGWSWGDQIHHEDREAAHETLRRALVEGGDNELEYRAAVIRSCTRSLGLSARSTVTLGTVVLGASGGSSRTMRAPGVRPVCHERFPAESASLRVDAATGAWSAARIAAGQALGQPDPPVTMGDACGRRWTSVRYANPLESLARCLPR